MDRRTFLRRSAIVAAGVVAADQLDILERLFHKRRFFPGFTPEWQPGDGFLITREMIEDDIYIDPVGHSVRKYAESLWVVDYKDTLSTRMKVLGRDRLNGRLVLEDLNTRDKFLLI